ncbi:MAG: hypothetical protein PHH98_03610 [Candidatus Gracilibacteria bacterium]|nr:hypothetical protein [Candidatus Gracilibacteria bacterium]
MIESIQNNFDFNGKSRELRLLTDSLNRGIEINSNEQFNKISILLKENKLFDLSNNDFDSISSNGNSFVIKKSNDGLNIYGRNDNFISRNFRSYSNNFRLVGVINDKTKFKSLVGDEVYNYDENNLGEKLISQVEKIRAESKIRLQKLKDDVVIDDENYTVEKGDNLWKIVKRKYGLTDNHEIANAINALVKHNSSHKKIKTDIAPPDGIKGDLIIKGKNIKLPNILKVLGKEIQKKS